MDQFLEHIYPYSEKIVRVGGRSKSELLKNNTLFELKKAHTGPRGISRLYRERDNIGIEIKNTLIELYEEPCVTIDFITSIGGLKPRQIESLRRISEREKNRPVATPNAPFLHDDDSDDDWEISSVQQAAPKKPVAPAPNNRNGRGGRGGRRGAPIPSRETAPSSWAGGNPNRITEVKEKQTNPVEIWLKEAIDYVDNAGVMSSFAEEMKESILEQEKGLVFDEDPDEREVIEEEELREIQQDFRGDDMGPKNPFIQIGKAYQRQTEVALGERPERKVVNYQKIRSAVPMDSQKFNFFEDEEEDIFEDDKKYSLENWMKEDDVSMWPLPIRLKAHKMWVEDRNTGLEAKLNALMNRYHNLSIEIRKLMAAYEAKICKENRVVGMTSTAAVSTLSQIVDYRF